jgi:phosphate starvation-inducible PhoH-like protein
MRENVHLTSADEARILFGPQDATLKAIRDAFGVKMVVRDGALRIEGDDASVEKAVQTVNDLLTEVQRNGKLEPHQVESAIYAVKSVPDKTVVKSRDNLVVEVPALAKKVYPRTAGQEEYLRECFDNDLVFAVGPAGTGKTYLAVALATSQLQRRLVKKIVLCRPAVEAGEKLGFLPGDLKAKVNPYLRPLYDALEDMMDYGQMMRYMENDMIEVIPLAFMRGRTLNNSFIILDEAQNTTALQMKMFLTRLGNSSRAIVNGDATQVDLPSDQTSGLVDAMDALGDVPGVSFVKLTSSDVVRHRLVQAIIDAYEKRSSESSG